jgi:hypothetical protein
VQPNERTVVITRVFDAPRKLVWKAWTDPKHVAQWWGPQGFTNPVCELDVRREFDKNRSLLTMPQACCEASTTRSPRLATSASYAACSLAAMQNQYLATTAAGALPKLKRKLRPTRTAWTF